MTEIIYLRLSGAESQILGALSKLDVFFLNSQTRLQSRTVPRALRDTHSENQQHNEDGSESYIHPEVDAIVIRFPHTVISDPDSVLYSFQ